MRRTPFHALVPVALLLASGCGGSDGNSPTPTRTATVSGTVRSAATNAPLAGAAVTLGSRAATSAADGSYELTDVVVRANATITATLAGYADYQATIDVAAPATTHQIALAVRTLYENEQASLFIPADMAAVRGVLVYLGGFSTRGVATGQCTSTNADVCAAQAAIRQTVLALTQQGFALMGTEVLNTGANAEAVVFGALQAFAAAGNHPELAQAPILLFGISSGAPQTYALVVRRPERVLGFWLSIPSSFQYEESAGALGVPGLLHQAELDTEVDNDVSRFVYDTSRAQGARWALAVEPNGLHVPLNDVTRGLFRHWMEAVIARRLPAGATAPVALDESSGWLGDLATGAVSAWAAYPGERNRAAWLPTQAIAQEWSTYVTSGGGGGALRGAGHD